MTHYLCCVCCGEVTTLIGVQNFAGWYRCPVCSDLGLLLPETDLTPRNPDAFSIEQFSTIGGIHEREESGQVS